MKAALFVCTALLLSLAAGCVSQKPTETTTNLPVQQLSDICIEACKKALIADPPVERGPCLLNPIPEDRIWVCDMAHDPREPIDDLPENQCSAFRAGRSTHFIDVTPDCKLIKAV